MIPGHKWVRCEAFGRAQQSFGQTTCHRTTPGDAMFLPPPNPVVSTEHAPLCHTPRMPRRTGDAWFWGCLNYPTCTAPTTTTPPVPQNLNTLLLKQQTKAVNDRIPAKGCRHLLVEATNTMKESPRCFAPIKFVFFTVFAKTCSVECRQSQLSTQFPLS